MTNPTSVRLDDETLRQIDELKRMWGDSSFTSVLRRAVEQAHSLEIVRRNSTDGELLGYLAEKYPAEGR